MSLLCARARARACVCVCVCVCMCVCVCPSANVVVDGGAASGSAPVLHLEFLSLSSLSAQYRELARCFAPAAVASSFLSWSRE